ncbi:hypothetical protein RCL1_003990 [Eukaryota sp. TZLM3-RCL]
MPSIKGPPPSLSRALTELHSEFATTSPECPALTYGIILPSDSPICKPVSTTSMALIDPLSSSNPRLFNFTSVFSPENYIHELINTLDHSLSLPSSIFFFLGPSSHHLFTKGFLSQLLCSLLDHDFYIAISTIANSTFYALDGTPCPASWEVLKDLDMGALELNLAQMTCCHVYIHLKNSNTEIVFAILVSPESIRVESVETDCQSKNWIAVDQLEFSRLMTSLITNDWMSSSATSSTRNPFFSILLGLIPKSKICFSFFISNRAEEFSDCLNLLKFSASVSMLSTVVVPKISSNVSSPSPLTFVDQSITSSSISMNLTDKTCTISLFNDSKAQEELIRQYDDVDFEPSTVDSFMEQESQMFSLEDTPQPPIKPTDPVKFDKNHDTIVDTMIDESDLPLARFTEPASNQILIERLKRAQDLIGRQEHVIQEIQSTSEESFLTLTTALEDSKRRILDLEERLRVLVKKREIEDVVDYYEGLIGDLHCRLDKLMAVKIENSTRKGSINPAVVIADLKTERDQLISQLKKLRSSEIKNQSNLMRNQLKETRKELMIAKRAHDELNHVVDSQKREIDDLRVKLANQSVGVIKKPQSLSYIKELAINLIEAQNSETESVILQKMIATVPRTPPRTSPIDPPVPPPSSSRVRPSPTPQKRSRSVPRQATTQSTVPKYSTKFLAAKLSSEVDPLEECLKFVKKASPSEARRMLSRIQDFILENVADFL